MFCASCGKEVQAGSSFCGVCGMRLSASMQTTAGAALPGSMGGVTDELVRAFVGKNADVYLSKFRSFRIGPADSFQVTWNWSAFLFHFWWFLYRKMYLWSLVAFFVVCIPWVGFFGWIAMGVAGNWLYHRHVKGKVAEASALSAPDSLPGVLSRMGGVNGWVPAVAFLAVGLAILLSIIFFGALAALIGIGAAGSGAHHNGDASGGGFRF